MNSIDSPQWPRLRPICCCPPSLARTSHVFSLCINRKKQMTLLYELCFLSFQWFCWAPTLSLQKGQLLSQGVLTLLQLPLLLLQVLHVVSQSPDLGLVLDTKRRRRGLISQCTYCTDTHTHTICPLHLTHPWGAGGAMGGSEVILVFAHHTTTSKAGFKPVILW